MLKRNEMYSLNCSDSSWIRQVWSFNFSFSQACLHEAHTQRQRHKQKKYSRCLVPCEKWVCVCVCGWFAFFSLNLKVKLLKMKKVIKIRIFILFPSFCFRSTTILTNSETETNWDPKTNNTSDPYVTPRFDDSRVSSVVTFREIVFSVNSSPSL